MSGRTSPPTTSDGVRRHRPGDHRPGRHHLVVLLGRRRERPAAARRAPSRPRRASGPVSSGSWRNSGPSLTTIEERLTLAELLAGLRCGADDLPGGRVLVAALGLDVEVPVEVGGLLAGRCLVEADQRRDRVCRHLEQADGDEGEARRARRARERRSTRAASAVGRFGAAGRGGSATAGGGSDRFVDGRDRLAERGQLVDRPVGVAVVGHAGGRRLGAGGDGRLLGDASCVAASEGGVGGGLLGCRRRGGHDRRRRAERPGGRCRRSGRSAGACGWRRRTARRRRSGSASGGEATRRRGRGCDRTRPPSSGRRGRAARPSRARRRAARGRPTPASGVRRAPTAWRPSSGRRRAPCR